MYKNKRSMQTNKQKTTKQCLYHYRRVFFFPFSLEVPLFSHNSRGQGNIWIPLYSMFYPFFLLFPLQQNIPSVLSPPSMDVFLWLPWVPSSETSQQFTSFCSFQGRTDRRHYPMGINSIDLLYSRYFNYFFNFLKISR